MADDEQTQKLRDFPDGGLPCVFADGVISAAWGRGVVKIYFGRLDPHLRGQGGTVEVPIAQLVMPIEGFEATAKFFATTLQRMADAGLVAAPSTDAMAAENASSEPSGK